MKEYIKTIETNEFAIVVSKNSYRDIDTNYHIYDFEAIANEHYLIQQVACENDENAIEIAHNLIETKADEIIHNLNQLITLPSHQDWCDRIKESLDYYAKIDNTGNNPYHNLTFQFATANQYANPHYNTQMRQLRKLFNKLGYKTQAYDTVLESFNYNQDFIAFKCPKCIRDYNYALPVSKDINTLASIVEIIYSGNVYCIIEENK